MATALNMAGQKFGRLIVLERSGSGKLGVEWLCQCDCGRRVIVVATVLKRGIKRSCGCLVSERTTQANTTHGGAVGLKKPRLYRIWKGMRARCSNKNLPGYPQYGGRGISVCKEWAEYAAFRDWALGAGYSDALSIDRIDNNGNYSPANCRWADQRTQSKNTRRNTIVELNGAEMTLPDAAAQVGLSYSTVARRIARGKSVEEALHTPRRWDTRKGAHNERPHQQPQDQ